MAAQMSSVPASLSQLMTLAGRGGGGGGGGMVVSDCKGGLFTSVDDKRLAELVAEKHSPDGRRLDIARLLPLVQDIFARATQTLNLGEKSMESGSSSISSNFGAKPLTKPESSPDLALTIERVSCEMGCKCLTDDTVDGHSATLAVLSHVSQYPWEAKLVVTQAAFAVNYGEFLLLSQVYSTSPLAQSMAQIKQLPSILKNEALMRQLDAIGGLIKAMLDVTEVVVEIASGYGASDDVVKDLVAQFPMTVYYVIRSAVAAAAHISLISTTATDQYMPTSTELELTNWTNKLKLILAYLQKMKETADQTMVEKTEEEAYKKLCTIIFDTNFQDNKTVIANLINLKSDLLPLFDGDTKKRVELSVLYGKTVLLLISGLDMDPDQVTKLQKIYNDSKAGRGEDYTIVWVPVVDPTTTTSDPRFEELQSVMPWYSVSQPSIVSKATKRLFIHNLNFKGEPILVTLDPKGKITSSNALHMMWIWKNDAFPFSLDKELALWKQQDSFRLELLVDDAKDEPISNWVKEDKYIFVYGGDADIEWIKNFINLAGTVAAAAKIDLELLYVGKSCKKEMVQNITDALKQDSLGNYLNDIPFFWTRLSSMLQSKIQLGSVDDVSNNVTQDIKEIISYDQNPGTWAVICKGSKVLKSAAGGTLVDVLGKYDEWKGMVGPDGGLEFHLELIQNIEACGPEKKCYRFEFAVASENIPDTMKCPGCREKMKNYVTFKCCHDDEVEVGSVPKISTRASPIAI